MPDTWLMLDEMTQDQLLDELKSVTRWLHQARMECLSAEARASEVRMHLLERFDVRV